MNPVIKNAIGLFVQNTSGDPVTLVDAEVQRDPDYQARLKALITKIMNRRLLQRLSA